MGFGKDVHGRFPSVKLCKSVEIPERLRSEIELVNLCRVVKKQHPKLLQRSAQEHCEDSAQVGFSRSQANLIGIASGPGT